MIKDLAPQSALADDSVSPARQAAVSYSPSPDPVDYEIALEKRTGGDLSAANVGHLLGITLQAVAKRRRARCLLAIRRNGFLVYPRAQFHGNDTIPCLSVVVQGLEASGPEVTLEFLVTPDDALEGLSPRDALLKGDDVRDRVLAIVRGCQEGEGFS
jgi:hypothetical protein